MQRETWYGELAECTDTLYYVCIRDIVQYKVLLRLWDDGSRGIYVASNGAQNSPGWVIDENGTRWVALDELIECTVPAVIENFFNAAYPQPDEEIIRLAFGPLVTIQRD